MGINQGIGQTSYSRNQGTQRKGRPATITPPETFSAVNPILAQVGTVTIGGTASDGNYVLNILDVILGVTHTVTVVRATTPSSNANIATALAAAIAADGDLRNIVSVADDLAAVLTLTFLHAGRVYTVTTSETTATGTIVWAETQAPGGSALSVARFVRYGTEVGNQKAVQALTTTSLAADVVAYLLTPQAEIANQGGILATDEDQYLAGDMVNGAYRGKVMAENVGGAGSDGGFVFVVVSTAGGDELGEMRADADGTAHVMEASPAAGNDLHYNLSIALIDLSTGETVHSETIGVLSDGSGTAAEVTDAAVIKVDASALVTQHGCTSANVSDDIEITAPIGFRLDVADGGGAGVFTVAQITALVQNTIRLPKAQARLDQDIAANATGRIYVNLPA